MSANQEINVSYVIITINFNFIHTNIKLKHVRIYKDAQSHANYVQESISNKFVAKVSLDQNYSKLFNVNHKYFINLKDVLFGIIRMIKEEILSTINTRIFNVKKNLIVQDKIDVIRHIIRQNNFIILLGIKVNFVELMVIANMVIFVHLLIVKQS